MVGLDIEDALLNGDTASVVRDLRERAAQAREDAECALAARCAPDVAAFIDTSMMLERMAGALDG